MKVNTDMSEKWPNITTMKDPPADAAEWKDKPNKRELLSEKPGEGD
jgi:ferredoxin